MDFDINKRTSMYLRIERGLFGASFTMLLILMLFLLTAPLFVRLLVLRIVPKNGALFSDISAVEGVLKERAAILGIEEDFSAFRVGDLLAIDLKDSSKDDERVRLLELLIASSGRFVLWSDGSNDNFCYDGGVVPIMRVAGDSGETRVVTVDELCSVFPDCVVLDEDDYSYKVMGDDILKIGLTQKGDSRLKEAIWPPEPTRLSELVFCFGNNYCFRLDSQWCDYDVHLNELHVSGMANPVGLELEQFAVAKLFCCNIPCDLLPLPDGLLPFILSSVFLCLTTTICLFISAFSLRKRRVAEEQRRVAEEQRRALSAKKKRESRLIAILLDESRRLKWLENRNALLDDFLNTSAEVRSLCSYIEGGVTFSDRGKFARFDFDRSIRKFIRESEIAQGLVTAFDRLDRCMREEGEYPPFMSKEGLALDHSELLPEDTDFILNIEEKMCKEEAGHYEKWHLDMEALFCSPGGRNRDVKKRSFGLPDLRYLAGEELQEVRERTGRRSRSVSPLQRQRILRRDNFTCQLCGAKGPGAGGDVPLEVDHKLPFSMGGDDSDNNLWTLCQECNRGKGNRFVD